MRTARTQLLPWKGGEGTSDNEEEDTDDVATVDHIDEGGDKKHRQNIDS
jgi:hypothetical protein